MRQRVRRRGNKPPLPIITLANLRSINNKIDEIRALTRYNTEFRSSSLLCFTETWLSSEIPSETVDVSGFQIIRLDRSQTETQKSKVGGVCIYINGKWCRNYKIRFQLCQRDVELLGVSFRPFYLPREFGQIKIIAVYVPPDADEENAAATIAETVNSMEMASPDAPTIVLGDFNHCRIEGVLPNYQQNIYCATRGNNILDRCYCSVKDAYKPMVRPSIGRSDHLTVHLLPKYRQLIKREKIKKRKVKVWDETAIENLQTCFEISDWDAMTATATDLDEAVDIVNGYILFCQDLYIHEKSVKI